MSGGHDIPEDADSSDDEIESGGSSPPEDQGDQASEADALLMREAFSEEISLNRVFLGKGWKRSIGRGSRAGRIFGSGRHGDGEMRKPGGLG